MSAPVVSVRSPRRRVAASPRRAFTLIELLLVLVILGVLAAVVVPKLTGRKRDAEITAAKTQISNFEQALDLFEGDVGRYPSTEEGLKGLIEQPANVQNWKGYLKKNIPADPWGNEYQYKSESESYTIWSWGPDGRDGTDDDISSAGTAKK